MIGLRPHWLAAAALAGLLAAPGMASARSLAKKSAANRPARKAAPARAPSAPQPKERAATPVSAPAPAAASSARASDDGDGATTTAAPATTKDGKVIKTKSYSFGAMDVEGKLKTPQLLYFLNRVKLELDMSAPDKRSFMKELQQSADDKNL